MSVLSLSSSTQLVPSQLNGPWRAPLFPPSPPKARCRDWGQAPFGPVYLASNGLSCRGGRGSFLKNL